MAPTPTGRRLLAGRPTDGGIFSFGDAVFYGSTGEHPPEPARRRHGADAHRAAATGSWPPTAASSPSATPVPRLDGRDPAQPAVVGMAATRPGGGLLARGASDGGIFAFGDAGFLGSTGGIRLAQPDRRHGGAPQSGRLLVRGGRRRRVRLRRRAVPTAPGRPCRAAGRHRGHGGDRRRACGYAAARSPTATSYALRRRLTARRPPAHDSAAERGAGSRWARRWVTGSGRRSCSGPYASASAHALAVALAGVRARTTARRRAHGAPRGCAAGSVAELHGQDGGSSATLQGVATADLLSSLEVEAADGPRPRQDGLAGAACRHRSARAAALQRRGPSGHATAEHAGADRRRPRP